MDFGEIARRARDQQKSHGFSSFKKGASDEGTNHASGMNGTSTSLPSSPPKSSHPPLPNGAPQSPSTPATTTNHNDGMGGNSNNKANSYPTRPRHKSQASFDWFGHSPTATDSNNNNNNGTPNSLSLPTPTSAISNGHQKKKRTSSSSGSKPNGFKFGGLLNSNGPSDSPLELSDDEEQDPNSTRNKDKEVSSKDKDKQKEHEAFVAAKVIAKLGGERGSNTKAADDVELPPEVTEFKGAFTQEDKGRGARNLKRSSGSDTGGKKSSSEVTRGATTTAAAAKRKSTLEADEDEDRDRFEELQDGDAAEASSRKPDGTTTATTSPNRPTTATSRKQSLWQGAAGLLGVSNDNKANREESTEEDADVEDAEDGEGRKAKASQQNRKGSAWDVVKKRLGGEKAPKQKTGATLSGSELVSELTTGILPMVLVKMAVMDRDERGDHRIPILMNYLKLRITDSVYPFHDRHAVFRCELEYGDAAVKWVIYRELKDFINLHAHYRVANLRQGIEKFPTFPKTSIPYLNWLKTERGGSVAKADFAKAQREALEDYLLKLIRATMFGPGANRLCKFLEISAMSLSLATRGGEQGKQGYLTILSSGASRRKAPGFHPLAFKNRHEPKWFIVRDSYIVAVDDPASTEIYDVIMVDFTFELERPKRILRQGLSVFQRGDSSDDEADDDLVRSEHKPQGIRGAGDPLDPSTTGAGADPSKLKQTSNHTFYLRTSERKLRLVAKTERQQDQFIASIEKMLAKTIWAGKNRFDSFAPIRLNASAQWLIDGRDYYWSLSRAILLAKHRIYIHDWWLSPELYLRRPPAENEQWRLDRLLQKKAEEGVQIFVIVYKEVSNDFTPVESNYTKTRLRALHPNVHIQRSPSHTSTGTLLWSHHEKMCVIDETIGFMGGLDLCFGRWDTPGHVLADEGPNVVFDPEKQHTDDKELRAHSQIWPGKDYANSRVIDFHTLTKPEEDMYDRSKVPRQPWHDIGLQIIGQPARDLCRHFIQRWNYLLRTKNHTVKMPFLLPAPDFTPKELHDQRITGTCEVQICRSVGPWSMGISHVEHSIQNAYIKAIQLSDHFVYIENQFFITSTEVEGTVIENRIGDALVSRILRAASEGTPWRAIVIIPLVPGYPFPIDHSDAGSVRLIMECQYQSICRGEHSIFARLRREGIDPDEYIAFFGLRGWGKLSSGMLTTEAVYIHAKAMIVDDRIAIIGSANLNERSQRGDRDSELACIIRDTDMIDSTMAGKPYQVGRFAHTMRVRLMREHLGVDVDELDTADEDLLSAQTGDAPEKQDEEDVWDPDHEQTSGDQEGQKVGHTFHWAASAAKTSAEHTGNVIGGAKEVVSLGMQKGGTNIGNHFKGFVDKLDGATEETVEDDEETPADKRVQGNKGAKGFASTVVPTLEEKIMAEGRPKDGQKTESGEREGDLTANQREQKDGVTVEPPGASKTDEKEGEQREKGDEIVNDKSAKDVNPKDQEHDNQKMLGEQATFSNPDADDTRKFEREPVMIGDDGKQISSSSTESDETEGEHKHKDPKEPKTEKNADGQSRIQDEAPPTDISHDKVINKGHASETSTSYADSSSAARDASTAPSSPPSSSDAKSISHDAKANTAAANRTNIAGSLRRNLKERGNVYSIPVPAPKVDPFGFTDPLVDAFYKDVWLAAAVRNTQAYRKVFRCVPDDLVQTWKQYREFQIWAERHNKAPKDVVPPGDEAPHSDPAHHSGNHGAGGGGSGGGAMGQGTNEPPKGETMNKVNTRRDRAVSSAASTSPSNPGEKGGHLSPNASTANEGGAPTTRRDRSGTVAGEGHDHEEGFPQWEREQMEECLEQLSGSLVVFPTRFLESESAGGNFL